MSTHPDDLLRLIARLYYVDGLDQGQVAEITGISRTQVSRMLTRARASGIVQITVSEYDPRDRQLEDDLCRSFGLKHAVVVRTAGRDDAESVRQAVGYFAAPAISELIHARTVLGVAGGRTTFELARHMAPTDDANGLVVVQLMGNIGASVSNTDAVEISRMLAHSLGGSFYTVNAPAFAADARSRDVFVDHPDVQSVWRFFGVMRIALVGIGTLQNSLFIARGALRTEDLDCLQAQGAVGEICGCFFDRNGQECETELRDRVISVGLDRLSRIEDTICVTHGTGRTEAIHAAIRGRLITSLVIDEAGARAVLNSTNDNHSAL